MSIKARPLSFADQVCQNNKKPTKLKEPLNRSVLLRRSRNG